MADELENFFRPRPPTFYLPGDPRNTNYVEMVQRLAACAAGLPKHQRPDRMYFTAKDYGAIVAELRAQYDMLDNSPHPTSDPGFLIVGTEARPFNIINAGTDDQAHVNELNRNTPGAIDFADRLKQFEVVHA